MSKSIKQLFSPLRPIDRTIEKVIDYYAQDEERLAREISEYEITENIESCFRKFLEVFREGVEGVNVPEVGIWVSGFYGSGKSSFTKYLGAALDPNKKVHGKLFLDLLCERFTRNEIPAMLRTISKKHPTAVIMLDLGAEQLVENTAAAVSTVLYWKVLQWAGFSKEKKTAQLEFILEKRGLYDKFKEKYREKYNSEWDEVHNNPLICVNRAAEIVPSILPEDFPTPDSYRYLRFEEARDIRDLAGEIIELCRNKTGLENIIFLIDEAGQYVAPRTELILNLDGLSRNFRELGKGKVWIVATGQQTLSEIVQKALHNSAELNKLRDRFPISITLEASDIKEITHRRLLEKSEEGRRRLKELFDQHGQSLLTHTRLTGTALFRGDPDAETFIRLYPFLPQHFELLLELIRNLARTTGGIGLRSAIRVIQDVLVDKSRVLSPGIVKLADREVGVLATVDHFYDTLRLDIAKVLPHVVDSVDKTVNIFGADSWEARVAKVVAALQTVENFPRTVENIAALLYGHVGSPSCLEEVREALRRLTEKHECGLIEDPQEGGFMFLSDAVKPIREKRNAYMPTPGECLREQVELLKGGTVDYPLFKKQPSARIENIKEVRAAVKLERTAVIGGNEDITLRLEFVSPEVFQAKRDDYLVKTNTQVELRNTIVLLAERKELMDEMLIEIVKSNRAGEDVDERTADRDVAQFLRSERRLAERCRDRAADIMSKALMDGVFIFRGTPTPAREYGETLDAAVGGALTRAAETVFDKFHLAPIRPATDTAAKFISVERLDRMIREYDLLALATTVAGSPRIDINKPVLAEVLRVFQQKAAESGSGRLQGSYLQDLFSAPPYGWTKDTVRYLFAALLRAGEVEFHKPGEDGVIRTAGEKAAEAVKNTNEFNRVGVSIRDTRPSAEALDRAASRLEELFGIEVLPLEDRISAAVRQNIPEVLEKLGALPARLRLLDLPGEERAQRLIADASDLLKGDAGDAAAYLGGVECILPNEIRWGITVVEVLDEGAEDELRKANSFVNALCDLEKLFPGSTASLWSREDRDVIADVLASERFHERLPELRAVIRNIKQRIKNSYKIQYDAYVSNLEKFVRQLEAHSGWSKLKEEDRNDIVGRLQCDLAEEAGEEDPVGRISLLITRINTLPGLLKKLYEEVENRQPQKDIVVNGSPEDEEEIIDADTLIEPVVIKNSEELDSWLSSLRGKLADILKQKKRVRIQK